MFQKEIKAAISISNIAALIQLKWHYLLFFILIRSVRIISYTILLCQLQTAHSGISQSIKKHNGKFIIFLLIHMQLYINKYTDQTVWPLSPWTQNKIWWKLLLENKFKSNQQSFYVYSSLEKMRETSCTSFVFASHFIGIKIYFTDIL